MPTPCTTCPQLPASFMRISSCKVSFFLLDFFLHFAPLVSFFHDRSFLQITDNPKLLWKLSWLVGLVDIEIQSKMMCILSLQSCPTLCDAMGWSLPSSSVHGILQARTLEWVTMPSSRGSSQPRDWTRISSPALAGGVFTTSAILKAQDDVTGLLLENSIVSVFKVSFELARFLQEESFNLLSEIVRLDRWKQVGWGGASHINIL